MKIAVIGSGLASVAACHALIKRGVKPVVLDAGELIDPERAALAKKLSQLPPCGWKAADRDYLTQNHTVHDGDFPRKLAFGSDYFYGKSKVMAPIESTSGRLDFPPFSYAKGGFSIGWGAAVLPPDDCDLRDWPIGSRELNKYYQEVLSGAPYSAKEDSLSVNFPLIKRPDECVKLTRGNETLIRALNRSGLLTPNRLVYGQSRLLMNADSNCSDGCKYCGCCMSGCVYGAIYKSSREIEKLVSNNQIDYRPGMIVEKLEEVGAAVKVSGHKMEGGEESFTFDRVFVAAGAMNSTRIVLQSKKLYGHKSYIKKTAGFVVPMLSMRKMPLDWPTSNTMPGVFLEYKVDGLSDHWVHTQLSTANEMVLDKLKITLNGAGLMHAMKRKLIEHLAVAVCNLHSDHANTYEIVLMRGGGGEGDKIISTLHESRDVERAITKAIRKLFHIGHKIGCYPIIPAIQRNPKIVGYHLGGSMPMRLSPESELDTDCFGRPNGWQRIHVVDSSVFPSIPGTTIGLLAMANAARIASEAEL